MTNGLPITAPLCCPSNGGGDLMPLLLVAVALLVGHIVLQEFRKRKGKPEMKNLKNLVLVAAVVVAVGVVFALKPRTPSPAETAPAAETVTAALPRLLELGADKCIPCKQMAPIIDDLRTTHAKQLRVDFIDVWKNPNAGDEYGVRVIPLQIFFDTEGRELFRHEGFFAKEDILAKWKELGFEFP